MNDPSEFLLLKNKETALRSLRGVRLCGHFANQLGVSFPVPIPPATASCNLWFHSSCKAEPGASLHGKASVPALPGFMVQGGSALLCSEVSVSCCARKPCSVWGCNTSGWNILQPRDAVGVERGRMAFDVGEPLFVLDSVKHHLSH